MPTTHRSSSRRAPRRPSHRLLGPAAVASVCLLAALAAPAQAATVSLFAAPAAAGAGDCSSPADACTVDTAVTMANAASVTDSVRIRLAAGTYALTSGGATALDITFAGPSLTLEADGGTVVLDGQSTVRPLSIDAASDVTIDGLQIKAGSTTGLGGGILNNGKLHVKHSTISNSAAANGGGISNTAGATLTVEDSTLTGNTSTSVGGGGVISFGTLTMTRSALTHNVAPVNGGGINVQPGGIVAITASTLGNNTSGGLGGAISNLGTIAVQSSTIVGNGGTAGSAFATGTTDATFAADIIGLQASGEACSPVGTAFVDGGYNLDVDGTCISATDPATGSHNGTTAYGASTYGAVLGAYLAGGLANNGGPSETFALLNTPSPATTLANPALAVVPSSFILPATAGGLPAPCSQADQRGVVPVPGASCDIGSYLLQTTTTALGTSAEQPVQDAPVTYTATMTPAAEGGTVAFDDGVGNPATTRCAAQPVTHGTATCTVSYPSTGEYRVAAAYSGDGAANNFVASASPARTVTVVAKPPAAAPPATTTTPDTTPPATKLRRLTSLRQPLTVRGSATDAGGVRRIRVSVARNAGKLCRFLQANRTWSKPRSCSRTTYIDAKGTTSWSLKLPVLPSGRYTFWSRGIDAAGNVERKDKRRNALVVRIPAT